MILIDVNIFMDIFEKRDNWQYSLELIQRVKRGIIKGYISAFTVPLIYFLLSKSIVEDQARKYVKNIIKGFNIVPLSKNIIMDAFKSPIKDFEDAIQFQSCITVGCKTIITRNKKDFAKVSNKIRLQTPEEFITEVSKEKA